MRPQDNLSLPARLADTGRFWEALQHLEPVVRSIEEAGYNELTLLTEVLEECGFHERAEASAAKVLDEARADDSSKSRVLIAIARMRYHAGFYEQSNRFFAEAKALASESSDVTMLSRVLLAQLGTVADLYSKPALAAQVDEARRQVLRSGDDCLLGRFHCYLARFELLAGNLHVARRHLAAASRLFDKGKRPDLAARYAITEAGLNWFALEYQTGLQWARRAAEAFRQSIGNLDSDVSEGMVAWFLLHLGQFGEAERILRKALASELPPTAKLAMLDTLLNVLVATQRTEEASGLVDTLVAALERCSGERPSYHQVSCQASRIRFLIQTGRLEPARAIAEQAMRDAATRGEPEIEQRFRLFRVEALIGEELLVEAIGEVLLATAKSVHLAGVQRFQLDRVLGVLLEVHGLQAKAERHLARALRINRSTGNAWANIQAEADHARVAAAAGPGSLADPTDVVATMFELAPRADLLAHEGVDLLRAHQCADAITIVSIGQDDDVQVVPGDGFGRLADSGWEGAPDRTIRIPTGERAGRRFEILVQPKDDLTARLAVVNARKIVDAALELERLRQAERERQSLWPQDEIADDEAGVFVSADMTDLLASARRVAPTDIPVLLTGETGTGKEVLARAIHRASNRASKPFLAFNCAAVPRDLIESQLFGYRRGAFTGAHDAFPGVIRGAEGGTLFLDEIGEIPPEVQPKLLRFLETKEVHPLGETRPRAVDARIIAATNADLDRLVAERRFREDLFYRLNVVHFHLPPLRQRREEIPPLVHRFLLHHADELERGRPRVSEEAMEYLLLHGWPGNVRQLANEVRRAVALVEPDGTITPDTLSPDVRASRRTMPVETRPRDDEIVVRSDLPLARALERVERMMVTRALERAGGRFEEAAKLLGITRKGLFLKRKRLGLQAAPPG